MKRFFKLSIIGLFIAGLTLSLWAFVIEPRLLTVEEYNLNVKNWSPRLNDFKIAVIADIHGGSNFIDEAKIRQIVAETNKQEPDIIVLLGDYISEENSAHTRLKMPIETVVDNLKGLQAKYGVYAVLGNHDWLYDHQIVRRELERVGYWVLEDEAVSIQKNGENLRIIGAVDCLLNGSWGQNNSAARKALDGLEAKDGKIIILTHNPDALNYLTEEHKVSDDVVLFLAGHTHGGQVSFPFIGAPIVPTEFGSRYARGFIRDKGVDIFVSPGIGTSLMPVRFGVPPEISVLHIKAE